MHPYSILFTPQRVGGCEGVLREHDTIPEELLWLEKGNVMIDNQPVAETSAQPTRKTSIQDRSVQVGNIIIVNGYNANLSSLRRRFSEGGYQAQETAHFLLFTRQQAPATILVHWFESEAPEAEMQNYIAQELRSTGLLRRSDDVAVLNGIRDSFKMQEIRIRERSVPVGDICVMSGYGLDQRLLKQRFYQSGYQMQATDHFLLFTRTKVPSTILVHSFGPQEFNADMKYYLFHELQPLGLLKQSSDYGKIISGIIGSFHPEHTRDAWHNYGANTLQRFLLFLSTAHTPTVYNFYATVGMFAHWYQRVCELCVGRTFLDAGCESGFLPLVIAERIPFMERVVGLDIRDDLFEVIGKIAAERHLYQVQFVQADLLAEDLCQLGTFDTVTALEVLEHFTEEEMYVVLTNLLKMTVQRLIITVPYEEQPETIYEHKQTFTRQKLEAVGSWCVQQLGGDSRMWYEDCLGGLLLVERAS